MNPTLVYDTELKQKRYECYECGTSYHLTEHDDAIKCCKVTQ